MLRLKRGLGIFLIFIMLLLSFCGCGSMERAGSEPENSTGAEPDNASSTKAMGRYTENAADLSDKLSGSGNRLHQSANGNLVISDMLSDFVTTKDGGKTWGKDSRQWHTKMIRENTYPVSVSIGADNTVGVIYQEEPESDPRLMIILPDKTEISPDITITEDDERLYQVYAADDGRVFVSTVGSANLYEVKQDGSSELFLTLEERPELIQFQGDLMVIDGYGYDELVIYDMEKEEYIEDEALNEFVKENYKDRDNGGGIRNRYDMYFFFGEDGVLYLAGEKGLYRHVMGGSAMEQVIDGTLCSLGNPSYGLQGMAALENNEFVALFNGSRVIHYIYDPDIPTIPGERLKIYGLEDNETIRQAVSLYQTKNPDVYIEFEFGLSKDSSVTREDALKGLNTRIMAGEGPDILLMDNMPMDSYIEKGLLLDLSSAVDEVGGEEELFDNITEAVKKEGKLYAMPCEVWLPVMMAGDPYISGVNDLEDIAGMVEKLREDNPEKDLLGFSSEKGIMRLFSMACVPSWKTEEGDIDAEAVAEFLRQTKRIYDAQMDGLPADVLEEYVALNEYYEQNFKMPYDDTDDVRRGTDCMSYLGGLTRLLCGVFYDGNGYSMMTSIPKVDEFKNAEWIVMKGQGGNVFCAKTLLSVSTASTHTEQALDFVKFCLGKENQSALYNGLPVNKEAFEACLLPQESASGSSDICGSYTLSNDEGLYVKLIIYRPDEEQILALKQCLEEADTAYIKDDILENAVYEEGIAYMQGRQSLEEAVDAVEKKMSIYMSE